MADAARHTSSAPRIVLASTVALTFISFWRGASIVLSDLASSMFYAGGIAEQAVGKAAPWLILCVVGFSFAVRSVYMEGCSMFVRGGVYAVVRNSMGSFMARLSVSALIFDYLLTGPISSVSAGHYLGHLCNELFQMAGLDFKLDTSFFAVLFALAVTLYFWRTNIIGIHESSSKALRIIQVTTIMVGILLVWCPLTLLLRGTATLPPLPTTTHLQFSEESLGWFHGTFLPQISLVAFFIAFGHSFLAMSGFETLAQVYRELAYPKLKNLRRTANIVCSYAVLSTGIISLFAVMIIPDDIRPQFADNLIGGLSMNLAGPLALRIAFHVFVVAVGAMILSGAVNTAMIGANSVLNRVAEDGVLLDWFRKPHPKYGTTYRVLSVFVILQLLTIVASRGDVYLLGEAYAFGVVWSFFLKSCGVLVLRYQRSDQEYKVPLNFRIRGVEIPVGLLLTTLVLLMVALANLFSKRIATVYGIFFTVLLFVVFTVSQRLNSRRAKKESDKLEKFNLEEQERVSAESLSVRPGGMLVAVRDYNLLAHLKWALDRTTPKRRNVTVATVRLLSAGEAEYGLTTEQCFAEYERELFTRVVQMAEKEGKTVELLVVPGVDPFDALAHTAARLKSAYLVTGVSPRMSADELSRQIGRAWERLPEPRHPFALIVIQRDGSPHQVSLGPHPPRLWPQDVLRVHELWLQLSEMPDFGSGLHHRDIIGVALERLQEDLSVSEREAVLADLRALIKKRAERQSQS